MADLEEQKKAVLPFMQRAQEIQQADPKVAYYCRLYAIEQGMQFPQRAKEINGLLIATMNQLEKDKTKLVLDPENDRMYCESFAVKIFENADKVDRAGKATENTSRAYYAASIFLEVLNHFAQLEPFLVEKQRYAVWRAADIRKAIREGRPPLPPAASTPTPDPFDDLPLASGSSDFAYAAQSPADGPHLASSYSGAQSLPGSNSSQDAAPTGVYSGQRFKLGSQVLYAEPGSSAPEIGTVGQILQGNPSGCTYKVALRDRLVEAQDRQLVPVLVEGQSVVWFPQQDKPTPAEIVLVNDMDWPPSYLVKIPDGSERAAQAYQISPLRQDDSLRQTSSSASIPAAVYPSAASYSVVPPPSQFPGAHQSPVAGAQTLPPPPQPQSRPPPPPQPPAPAYAPPPVPVAGYKPPLPVINEAQKQAKYAVSALSFEDLPTAIKHLTEALKLLTQPK